MMKSKRSLVCFTASFPYGLREVYFETELRYLAENFEKVYIVPTYNPTGSIQSREVPDNVIVFPILVGQGLHRVIEGTFNRSPFKPFLQEFFKKKVYSNKNWLKNWFNNLLVYRIANYKLLSFLKGLPADTLLYSYWASIPFFCSSITDRFTKIIRMHGGDFYTERNEGYLPLRENIYRQADLLLPISKDIQSKLQSRYGIDNNRIFLNYLGVDNLPMPPLKANIDTENNVVLVSCSNLLKLKRVHLIPEVIEGIKGNVIWHHFGDGPEMDTIKKISANLSAHISVKLHGWTLQQDLKEFYASNHITWLINLSKFEGLPVSIMEAFSFSIPVIATDVGGTSEIVTSENGFLISEDFEPKEVSSIINTIKKEDYKSMRLKAYETWYKNFRAENNYKNLIKKINEL